MTYLDASDYPQIGDADYYPNVGMPEAAAAAAAGLAPAMASHAAFQADAERFISEHGAAVVDGHSPVGVAPPAESD